MLHFTLELAAPHRQQVKIEQIPPAATSINDDFLILGKFTPPKDQHPQTVGLATFNDASLSDFHKYFVQKNGQGKYILTIQ